MSKIDLSKAKLGDKFITKEGRILRLAHQGHKYTLIARGCFVRLNQNGKLYEDNEESKFDLVEQVFDNGDQLDNNISVEKRGEVLAEMTKSEYEKAKELGIDFLQVYIEKNPEEYEKKQERQRRQEVIALAEKLVVNEEMMKSHKDLFEAEVHAGAKTLTTYPAFVIRSAEDFIKYKNQYLKDGKL